MVPLVLVAIVLVLAAAGIGAIIRYSIQARKKRAAEMGGLAQRLGMSFQENPPLSIIPDGKRFELFNQGTGRDLRDHMALQKDGRRVSVFDYAFTIHAGKSHVTHRQTVVHIHAPGLNLPAFTLRPEHALHRLGGVFGYQDIDVDGDPVFSDAYLLRGVEEDLIRGCFSAPVREFFVANPGLCAEGSGADLMVWRHSATLPAQQIQPFMESAYVLMGRFLNSPGQRTTLAG
ncbi:hypothetical protein [Longimicrobium terrae]|uniref:DUF3137 domain-containing protein n=1 Tax=Longimicrobium terrae TaxID=1639882 RepID=A0A841GX76_9BACT|nr:hypothetical protein [Longimicrobium terrae]MBB4635112.1 hypothetical protein [Longimicrobium terrae]MBB6069506.1 hypothetical protein [Longimicrobium terrae]NNC31692.1 hypothetical protein [Longimicrobium terrae]